MLRILAITSLYPTSATPHSSAFNRQQLAALGELADLEIWGTVPWLPLAEQLAPGSIAAATRDVPARETIDGRSIEHPRTLHLPVIGRAIAGPLYAASLWRRLRERRGDHDVLLGTWAYPDGWAVALLARAFGVPAVIKVHGTDINGLDSRPLVRYQLRRMLPSVAGVVAVSRPLAERVRELGATAVHHVPNGVDTSRFAVSSRAAARAALGEDESGEVVLFIGNLKREKGLYELLEAWPAVAAKRPARLVIVGDGPERAALSDRVARTGNVSLVGAVAHDEIPTYLAACDVLALPSWNEGTPNVVLEALACGRPVVATDVGGIPDVLEGEPALGALVPPRDPAALGGALVRVLSGQRDAALVRERAGIIDWSESAARLHEVLAAVR